MKVLVTGSDGYIGVLLSKYLMDRGHDVTGLDTGFYREGWLYNGVNRPPLTITKDVRHVRKDDLRGFNAIVHLAELSNDPLGQLNPAITYKINHEGSVDLALLSREVGITRFVYTSSCSVYGIGAGEFKDERSEVNPQTAYARCKVHVERDVSALSNEDFSPTFLRNATAYGASPRMRFDLVLNNLAGLAWTTGEIKMISDGTPWRPLIHVLDICEAIGCVLEAPREVVHNEIFNVGSTEENYQIRDLAYIVESIFPKCQISTGTSDGDNRTYRVNCDKIASQLSGYKVRRGVKNGVRQLLELFRSIELTPSLFGFRAYTRLDQLKYLIRTQQINSNLFWKDPNGNTCDGHQ